MHLKPIRNKKWYESTFLLLIAVVVFVFFSINLVREVINRRELSKNIDQLSKQISDLKSRNNNLGDSLKYLQSLDFVEKEARTKLNLRKPGEKIIIVNNSSTQNLNNSDLELNKNSNSDQATVSNPSLWWNYFFGRKF